MPANAFALRVWQRLLARTPPARCLRPRAWLGTVCLEDCEASMSDTFVQCQILDWDCLPSGALLCGKGWVRTASPHSISKRTGPNTFSCLKALLASPTMAAHRRWCPCGHKQLSRLDSEQQLRVSSQLFWLAAQYAHFCARSGLPTRASSGRGRALRRGSSSARRATSRGGPWTRGTHGTHGATAEWGRFLRGKL